MVPVVGWPTTILRVGRVEANVDIQSISRGNDVQRTLFVATTWICHDY